MEGRRIIGWTILLACGVLLTMSSGNRNLQAAKNADFDEFYTPISTIEDELANYVIDCDTRLHNYFRGKVVYLNCDDPRWSNFWQYFVLGFDSIGIRRLVSTYLADDGEPAYVTEYVGETDGSGKPIVERRRLAGNGDFRSDECRSLLDEADIVCTNPPFSLFRDYVDAVVSHGKDFLIIGSINGVKYKEIFPLVKEGRIHLGVHSGRMRFRVPDGFERDNVFVEDGIRYAKFGNTCWYTNFDHWKLHQRLPLTCTYEGHESEYPRFDGFDAINVSMVKNIPSDYRGIMGVPITYMQRHCSDQFEIVGEFNHGSDNEYDLAKPVINGKELFPRIAIRQIL